MSFSDVTRACFAVLLAMSCGCCGSEAGGAAPPDEKGDEDDDAPLRDAASDEDSGAPFPVEIGTPDVITASKFVELETDGDVTIQDGGQGGTHALVALRFKGLGQWIYYRVAITDLDGGGEVETPELVRPRPTLCDEDLFECRLSPILVVIGGLADRDVWDGLHVEITATVSNEEGEEGVATTRAFLRR
jgi:hypothetical protein